MKIIALLILSCTVAACGCPKSGPDSRAEFALERDSVCAELEGCDPEFMASVPVYKVDDVLNSGLCDSEAVGCYCENTSCQTIIVHAKPYQYQDRVCKNAPENPGCWLTVEQTVLHEYTHAAFASVGIDTHDHPPMFNAVLQRAYKRYTTAALEQSASQ